MKHWVTWLLLVALRFGGGETISEIAVLGERNSGTHWLTAVLRRALSDYHVTNCFCGFKHFMQHECWFEERNQYLVVVIARNPFDWLTSFHSKPFNAPDHQNLTFDQFLHREWSLFQPGAKGQLRNRTTQASRFPHAAIDVTSGISCKAHTLQFLNQSLRFPSVAHRMRNPPLANLYRLRSCTDSFDLFQESLPLPFCGKVPAYEALGPGEPFRNILQMRTAKLENHRNLVSWFENVELVQYDQLISMFPTSLNLWLDKLASKYDLRLKERHDKSVHNIAYKNEKKGSAFEVTSHSESQFYANPCSQESLWTRHTLDFVHSQLDWEEERLWGFLPLSNESCEPG